MQVAGIWLYADTASPVADWKDRPCGHCGLPNTSEGHDGCLGTIPGAMNACCGHGHSEHAYVQYPANATDRAGVGEEAGKFWIIAHEPGMVPERKGPWKRTELKRIMREFIQARPTAYLHVLSLDSFGAPDVDHGPEVLQMLDGRSMSVGRKHNARTLAAHTADIAASPAPADAGGEVERLREALRPFVAHWESWMDKPRWQDADRMTVFPLLTFGDVRRARAALNQDTDHGK